MGSRKRSAVNINTIYDIAQEYRRWGKENTERFGHDSEDLSCMCAIVSYEIFHALRRKNIRAQFCINKYHSFVMVGDIVIDVTATQFSSNLPAVIVCGMDSLPKAKTWFDTSIWAVKYKTENISRIKSLLRYWPTEQQPIPFQRNRGLH